MHTQAFGRGRGLRRVPVEIRDRHPGAFARCFEKSGDLPDQAVLVPGNISHGHRAVPDTANYEHFPVTDEVAAQRLGSMPWE